MRAEREGFYSEKQRQERERRDPTVESRQNQTGTSLGAGPEEICMRT